MPKRLFIAIDPDPAAIDAILGLISTIKREYPISGARYTSPKNLHLTLLFLGDRDERLIPGISSRLGEICREFSAFDLSFSKLGVFPSRRSPRILWLGVENPLEVTSLAQKIIHEPVFGADPGKVQYSPHLTLARISNEDNSVSSEGLSKLFTNLGGIKTGSTRIREVVLYQSVLKPGGAQYTVLSKHPLN